MSSYLEETCNIPFDFAYDKLAESVVEFCLVHENFPYQAEVNMTLTDNENIHEINREYRGIDRPTDVLSFPLLSYEKPGNFDFLREEREEDFNPDTGEVYTPNTNATTKNGLITSYAQYEQDIKSRIQNKV